MHHFSGLKFEVAPNYFPPLTRNLRIREDTAKYLLNLDVNSAHYDPKTRSMREDPLPDTDPNEKFYTVSILSFLSEAALRFSCCATLTSGNYRETTTIE